MPAFDPATDSKLMALLRDVVAGRARFRRPPPTFDPLALSPWESVALGLPPPPGRADVAFALWHRLAKARVRVAVQTHALVVDGPRTGYNRLGLKGHMETSRNWAGAVIASPYRRRPFDLLIGTWTIPAFQEPAGKMAYEYACSTWIGFDGHRRISRSLPQIGTVQKISVDPQTGAATPSIKAWWQWWWDGTDGPHEYDPNDFPITVGDRMLASLYVISGIGVLLNMTNVDTGRSIEPLLIPPPDPRLTVRALDAECVLERPKPFNQPKVNFVVPRFEPTTFACHAFLRGSMTSRDMRGGRVLRMVHQGQDQQLETIATPIRDGDPRFVTLRYCGA